MEVKVLEAEETFLINERGLVIVGFREKDAPNLKSGDKIEFCCSDNSKISSEVLGIEMIKFNSLEARHKFTNKTVFCVRNLDDKKEILKGASVTLIS